MTAFPGCKWLGVIDGATHMNFAGIGFAESTEKLTRLESKAFSRRTSRRKMRNANQGGWDHTEEQVEARNSKSEAPPRSHLSSGGTRLEHPIRSCWFLKAKSRRPVPRAPQSIASYRR